MGLNKQVPDEFAVYSRAPLSLPPDYGLRPPEPGTSRPQRVMPRDEARQALAGGTPDTSSPQQAASGSPGIQALLSEAGALNVEPNIRQLVNRETSILSDEAGGFADRLIFWRDKEDQASVLDPSKEAKRLQEARALGEPLGKSEIPVISRKKKGLLEGILD
ncbi:MAG: DUF3035 domain-containing protein [Rhodospirillales bacterium]|nr:DUF3035 domain-containing protein [Rhodospirillales bacterium]